MKRGMKAEEFKKYALSKSRTDYGIFPPPTKPQDGLKILIKHFLGDGWYVTSPISPDQVNTEAIYEILSRYPQKSLINKCDWSKIKSKFLKGGENMMEKYGSEAEFIQPTTEQEKEISKIASEKKLVGTFEKPATSKEASELIEKLRGH